MADDTECACRVVLCDDAEDFVRIVGLLLTSEKLDVVGVASNGREAVEVCGRLRPDVLVLDVSMPIMDGLTALPLVLEASPDTRVIMLTGFGTRVVQQRAMELGAVDFIEKGVAPLELPAQIRAHC